MNGTRAAGGGGGGIVLPAAGAAGGAVEPVEAARAWCCRGAGAAVWRYCGAVGAEKVTEAAGAAGRVAERAEGGCREPAPMLEVIVLWWRSAVAISAVVERRWVSRWRRRPERSAWTASREAALAWSGCVMVACSSSAIERAQASAAVRAVSSTSAAARARARLASASWREIESIRARRAGSMLSQTCVRHPKWAGSPRGPPRGALGDTGASRRRPWERSVPEPEMARSADEDTDEDVS